MALSGVIRSNTGTNLNLRIDWSATQNPSANQSTITAKLYLEYKSLTMSSLNDSVLKRNWLEVSGTREEYIRPSVSVTGATSIRSTLLHTVTKTITHASSGSASSLISASMRLGGTYDGVEIGTVTASKTVLLDNIDQSAPTVYANIESVTTTSITVYVVASTLCNRWLYNIDAMGWIQVSTTNQSSISFSVGDLAPNTSHSIQVRATKNKQ